MPKKFKDGDLVTKTFEFIHAPYLYAYVPQTYELFIVVEYRPETKRYLIESVDTGKVKNYYKVRTQVKPNAIQKVDVGFDLEEWM